MKIQSFSVVVPSERCVNECPFCVSRMVNSNTYPNLMDINHPHYDINVREFLKRMRYVSDNGCQTMMLTGTAEPQQNKPFLTTLALLHNQLGNPFMNIEMQCTGMFLNDNRDYLRFLRNFVGVNTMALSINSLDDNVNNKILGPKIADSFHVKLRGLCDLLKDYDFNIRCCFNLNDDWESHSIDDVLKTAKDTFHADQVTFRKLYASDADTPQSKWINEHQLDLKWFHDLEKFLDGCSQLGTTVYGTPIKNVDGMSVIYDNDCMGKNPTAEAVKYLILRPNCKLYSSWDTPASLVF